MPSISILTHRPLTALHTRCQETPALYRLVQLFCTWCARVEDVQLSHVFQTPHDIA